MENKEFNESISLFMWHLGKILTDLQIVSLSTDSPIIVQTFQAAGQLFDKLGSCIYGSADYEEIFPKLNKFIGSIDYKADKNFTSVLDYAHDFSKDLLFFLGKNNLK